MPSIAILGGTGHVGPGLALRWARVGYRVIIGSRHPEKARRIAADLNSQLETDFIDGMQNADAAVNSQISVLTVVHPAHRAALESVKDELRGKILVDATARVEFRDPKPPDPPAAARIAQDILGREVRVVAAFQNVPAHVLKHNLGQRLDAAVLVCSDDHEAAEQVIRLAEAAGMNAYFAGGLDNAVVGEGLTAVLIAMNKRYKSKSAAITVTGIEKAKH